MTTALHPVPAPKFASFRTYDCARCSHEELQHPIFLSDGNAYGTGCAAKLLGTDTKTIALDAIAAEPELGPVVNFLNLCHPGRITPKFMVELNGRFLGRGTETVERAVTLWKAAK